MQQNYCSHQVKSSFWLELSHALPHAQMCTEDLMAGRKLSCTFAHSEERLLHESLSSVASAHSLYRCPFNLLLPRVLCYPKPTSQVEMLSDQKQNTNPNRLF